MEATNLSTTYKEAAAKARQDAKRVPAPSPFSLRLTRLRGFALENGDLGVAGTC